MSRNFVFSSRSVTEGHPDKLCDQISDAIVGQFLRQDPFARLAVECAVAPGLLFIAVRFAALASVDVSAVARQVIREVGYDDDSFSGRQCTIMTSIQERPPVTGQRFEEDLTSSELDAIGASDTLPVFGFACNHTEALMPLPIWLAHQLARRITEVRRKELPYLAPEAKTQVTVAFEDRKPKGIEAIQIIAAQTSPATPGLEKLRSDLIEFVINPVFAAEPLAPTADTRIVLNPNGILVTGGPAVHCGLTGRKVTVDTYGEYARQSGTALSGKDPSRIGRAGAYAARQAARLAIAENLADECEVHISYELGVSRPLSVQVETFGTGKVRDHKLAERLETEFDLRPGAILANLRLRHLPSEHDDGFYRKLAAYGQVGRTDLELPWEKADRGKKSAKTG